MVEVHVQHKGNRELLHRINEPQEEVEYSPYTYKVQEVQPKLM